MRSRLFTALAALAVATLAPGVAVGATFSNAATITINDAGVGDVTAAATPYPSTITVSGLSGTITKVTVTVTGLSHTSSQDIDILLVGPGGQAVMLMSDAQGNFSTDPVTLTFDDAGSVMPEFDPIASGTYEPSNYDGAPTPDAFPGPAPAGPYGTALSVFNGTAPNGDWKLFVIDELNGDLGQIAGGWSLDITVPAPANAPPTVNAGPDRSVTLPASASLAGSASDDGLPNPPAALTVLWTRTSGPGTVVFANPAAAQTTASFTAPGTYVLRLTASDGELSASDETTVTVAPEGCPDTSGRPGPSAPGASGRPGSGPGTPSRSAGPPCVLPPSP